jgi:tubulin beta
VKADYPEVFYEECKSGAWKSRSVLFDSDSSSIDYARSGRSSGIYGVDNFCFGNISTCSIFAKGRYGEGQEIVNRGMDKVRSQIERCDSLQGIQLIYSLSGGAGSGMGAELINKLGEEYPDIIQFCPSLFPSTKNPTI